MKIRDQYERLRHRVFTLSRADVNQALQEYVERHYHVPIPPGCATQSTSIAFADEDERCGDACVEVTQTFVYQDTPVEAP